MSDRDDMRTLMDQLAADRPSIVDQMMRDLFPPRRWWSEPLGRITCAWACLRGRPVIANCTFDADGKLVSGRRE